MNNELRSALGVSLEVLSRAYDSAEIGLGAIDAQLKALDTYISTRIDQNHMPREWKDAQARVRRLESVKYRAERTMTAYRTIRDYLQAG